MTTFRSIASRDEVALAIDRIVGEQCWSIVAGPGAGSVILLDLGAKLPREVKLRNSALTEEQRAYEAPYSIHVWCSWRVEQSGRVVGSWNALPDEDWWVRSGLHLLQGRRLTRYELGEPVPDLKLVFDDVRLSLFADTLSKDEDDCAYTVRTPDEVFVVSANSELQREWVEL
jgi:hypothetical protein